MANPRIIIADEDFDYIIPLQNKISEEYFNEVELEIITEKAYFNEIFCCSQTADVLIISENLYSHALLRHDISYIFVLSEKRGVETENLNVTYLYKYSSITDIIFEITEKSTGVFRKNEKKKQPTMVLFYSADGGTGKTTIAMGVASALARKKCKVLYLNVSGLQSFQYLLEDTSTINSMEWYQLLRRKTDINFVEIQKVIRNEGFDYLPPFKAPLISLGIDFDVYRKIAEVARNSGEYDYIVVDVAAVLDEKIMEFLNVADKIVIVMKQHQGSVFATNILLENICGWNSEKYLFICNDYYREDEQEENRQLLEKNYSISEYVEHIVSFEERKPGALAEKNSIRKTAMMLM